MPCLKEDPLVVVCHPIHNGCLVEIHVVVEFVNPTTGGEILSKEQCWVCPAYTVREQPIAEDEIMVSCEVIALFTSSPVGLALLQITREKLLQDPTLAERTDVSVPNIMRLLKFVLKNSFFSYEQEHYQQTFGCAMGSPVSATMANLVMEYIETRAMSTTAHPPKWRYRLR